MRTLSATPTAAPGGEAGGTAGGWSRLATMAVVAAVAAGVALRLWTRSDLWLDEALTVHIARLPLGDIPDALRHDGHPPLFYFLLHGWMRVFGEGDVAVRSLSAAFSVAALPLAWVAGRRYGGRPAAVAALLVLGTSPFAIRYATEARMYSLVILLVLAGWLLVRAALDAPGRARWALAGTALVSGLLLLTHYWAFYLVAATGAVLAWVAWRRGSRRATEVLVATAAGGLLFLPWLPGFLHQARHTGTPWAEPQRPASIVSDSLEHLGGGTYGEAVLLGFVLLGLVALGLVGRPAGPHRVELDLRTRPRARPEGAVVAGTFALATAGGYATASGFAPRYVAVVVPLVVLLAALGVAALPRGVPRAVALGAVVVLGLAGGVNNAATQRTQGGEVGRAISARSTPDDVVAFCPDQLGPAVARHLPESVVALTYPRGGSPERVDWVDYADRHAAARPSDFASRVLDAAGDRTVWLVWAPGYRTLGDQCTELRVLLSTERQSEQVVGPREVFEGAELVRYPAS